MREDQVTFFALVLSAVFLLIVFLVVSELWRLFLNVFVPVLVALIVTYYFFFFLF